MKRETIGGIGRAASMSWGHVRANTRTKTGTTTSPSTSGVRNFGGEAAVGKAI